MSDIFLLKPRQRRNLSREVTVVGEQGEPILYCEIASDGSLEAGFEIYGGNGLSDLEIINTIYSSEFDKIKDHFKIPKEVEILDAIEMISARGQGSKFKDFVRSGRLKGEFFSWMTDRD